MLSVLLVGGLLAVSAIALYELHGRRKLQREASARPAPSQVETSTALRSRRAFADDLELELRRCGRTGRPASLAVIRLAGLVSRTAPGRAALTDAIRAAVRSIDVAYRIGPDEVALIVPETRARGALVAVARVEGRLRAAGVPRAAITAGVAELGPGVDRRQLCREAYCALLVAGSDGRPRILAYSPELERAARSRGLKGLGEVESFGGPAA